MLYLDKAVYLSQKTASPVFILKTENYTPFPVILLVFILLWITWMA